MRLTAGWINVHLVYLSFEACSCSFSRADSNGCCRCAMWVRVCGVKGERSTADGLLIFKSILYLFNEKSCCKLFHEWFPTVLLCGGREKSDVCVSVCVCVRARVRVCVCACVRVCVHARVRRNLACAVTFMAALIEEPKSSRLANISSNGPQNLAK